MNAGGAPSGAQNGIVPRVEAQIVVALKEALIQRCTSCSMSIGRVDACCHMKCGQCNAEFSSVCDVCHVESCTRCGSSLYHHGLRRLHFVMDPDKLPDA